MSDWEKEQEKRQREFEKEQEKREREHEKEERKREKEREKEAREGDIWEKSDHERMARAADPRDTDGNGVVSPQEAAAYVSAMLTGIPEKQREDVLDAYFRSLNPSERAGVADALGQASNRQPDPASVADAYAKAVQQGNNPLETAFAKDGIGSELVKAGLIGLAAVLGSKALDNYRQRQAEAQAQTPGTPTPPSAKPEGADREPADPPTT